MQLRDIIQSVLDFVKEHQVWALVIVGFLALGKSSAILSLIIPAIGALIGLGTLIGANDIQRLIISRKSQADGLVGWSDAPEP